MKRKARPTDAGPWKWQSNVPTAMYLDDLREVWAILEQLESPIEAETESWSEIRTVDDLVSPESAPTKYVRLSTSGAHGAVEVALTESEASVTLGSRRAEYLGVQEQVKQLVWRRWRRFAPADTGWFVGLQAMIFAVPLGLNFGQLPGLALFFLGFGLLNWSLLERRRRWVVFPGVLYRDRPKGFFRQNQDQIILTVVTGLIFLVLGYLLGAWDPLNLQPAPAATPARS